jgi:hypothetical protein
VVPRVVLCPLGCNRAERQSCRHTAPWARSAQLLTVCRCEQESEDEDLEVGDESDDSEWAQPQQKRKRAKAAAAAAAAAAGDCRQAGAVLSRLLAVVRVASGRLFAPAACDTGATASAASRTTCSDVLMYSVQMFCQVVKDSNTRWYKVGSSNGSVPWNTGQCDWWTLSLI